MASPYSSTRATKTACPYDLDHLEVASSGLTWNAGFPTKKRGLACGIRQEKEDMSFPPLQINMDPQNHWVVEENCLQRLCRGVFLCWGQDVLC